MNRLTFLICILYTFNGVFSSNLPLSVTPCNRTDPLLNECILKEAKKWQKSFMGGLPELGVPPMDPLFVEDITTNITASMYFSITNTTIVGMMSSIIRDMKFNPKDQTIFVDTVANYTTMASFKMHGDGLILNYPLEESGEIVSEAKDVFLNWTMKYEFHNRSNNMYIRIVSLSIVHHTSDMKINMTGFRSVEMGNIINRVFNENWRYYLSIIATPGLRAMSSAVAKILNKFFSKVPFDDLFV